MTQQKININIVYSPQKGSPHVIYRNNKAIIWNSPKYDAKKINIGMGWYSIRKPRTCDSLIVIEPRCVLERDYNPKYIEDYISLQSIRLHNHLAVDVQINIEDPQAKIPPLLLIILVENAFKHGIEPASDDCFLRINLQITSEYILFTCENSVEYDNNNEDKAADSIIHFGVGLENLQRRLNLLYLNKHQLTLQPTSNSFMVKLKLSL